MASLLLPDGGRKKAHHVGRFFQQHALGLTARLSDVINDLLNRNPPVQEKRRYIKAMEEMVRVSKSYVRIARPQVRAHVSIVLCAMRLYHSCYLDRHLSPLGSGLR